ncbi:hypothetical protein HPB47_006041 [Ixodes persulcatus]|uniref:Uncharacterized protein n=1 Tax=Ixodes persulcatus TaxID=34615 RepID=A0AC60PBC1_IXOPE|nr:hypothetical protein HPB47_006041 [Ixodes persulcatus]
MEEHSCMHLYAAFKTHIAAVRWCGNTLGSRLFSEARGGALRTRIYRQRAYNCPYNADGPEDVLRTSSQLHNATTRLRTLTTYPPPQSSAAAIAVASTSAASRIGFSRAIANTLGDPFRAARDIRDALQLEISDTTVGDDSTMLAYTVVRVAFQSPLLTERHKQLRLDFAPSLENSTVEDWTHVIFSNESTFCTRLDQQRREVATSGRRRVNVWGAISRQGLGPIFRIDGRLTSEVYSDIIDHVLMPYVLDGPFPDGADVNIIENVWGINKSKLATQELHSAFPKELCEAVQRDWNNLRNNDDRVHYLYGSLPHRIQSLLHGEGNFLRY